MLTTFWLLGRDDDEKCAELLGVTNTKTFNDLSDGSIPGLRDP